jgi:hypothetical protein
MEMTVNRGRKMKTTRLKRTERAENILKDKRESEKAGNFAFGGGGKVRLGASELK